MSHGFDSLDQHINYGNLFSIPNFFGVLYILLLLLLLLFFFLNKCVHFCLRFYPHVSGCDLSLGTMPPSQLEAGLQLYVTYLSDTIVIGVKHQLCYLGAHFVLYES